MTGRTAPPNDPIVAYDGDGRLDEIFATRPREFHFEAMSDTHWWIGLTTADGRYWHINLCIDGTASIEAIS